MGTATAARGGRKPASLRTLWAIAKSPELGLSDDDLHAVVYRETGKESMRKLTQGEINALARVLQNMKDGASRRVNGFVKRITGVDRLEWLTPGQCEKVIEALKAMVARQEAKKGASV